MPLVTSLVALGIAIVISAPAQDTPRELRDLIGARAGQAEGELESRGYRNIRGEKGDDRSYTYWWNTDRRQCVTIATLNGRYDSITATPAPDCRQPDTNTRRRRDRGARDLDIGLAADLPRYCKGEAAAAFDRRPGEITTNAAIRQPTGFVVQGWFDREKRTRFFTCRFDANGRFLSVN